jgi:hypothetical protein
MDLSTLSRGRAIAGALLLIAALFLAGRHFAGAGTATESGPTVAAAAGELRAEPRPRLIVHVVGARACTASRTARASPTRFVAPAAQRGEPT